MRWNEATAPRRELDREIADELFISVRTVGYYGGNILNKTTSSNRAEAATYASRNGLV